MSLLLNDRFVSFPGGWTSLSHELSLPTRVVGASEIKLYLEVSPSSDFDIDEVSLTEVDNGGGTGGDWEEAAALRIDALRKKDLALQVVMPEGALYNQLVLEVTQLGHKFPFGTAVKSPRIANCWDADNGSHLVNDAYCSFVGENFNWVVDTYRMKWKPMEPMEGQIDTEVKERLKYASFVCKPVLFHTHPITSDTRQDAPMGGQRSVSRDQSSWARSLLGEAVEQPPVGAGEGVWVQVRGAFPQELYGEDLVTAMVNRVNFTVNHYHQVKDH